MFSNYTTAPVPENLTNTNTTNLSDDNSTAGDTKAIVPGMGSTVPLADGPSSGFQLPSLPAQPPGTSGVGGGGGNGADGQAKLILGTFQAVVMPFNPSMIGSIIGAMPSSPVGSGSSGLPQQIPTLPTMGSG